MKRHLKMSLVFIVVLLTFALIFTGCNEDELVAQIDENAIIAENAVNDAAEKALADLEAAKAEIQKQITDGDKASADALTAKVAEINAAIETAKTIAANADTALKAELNTAIEAAKQAAIDAAKAYVDGVRAELEEAMADGDAVNATALATAKTELQNAIDVVNNLCTVLVAKDAELDARISEAIVAINAAGLQLEAWNATTENLISAALGELTDAYEEYKTKELLYTADGFAKITAEYNAAYIRLMRAPTLELATQALDTFKANSAAIRSITDEIYDKLMEAGTTVDEIELTAADKALLDTAGTLLNNALNIADPSVLEVVIADITYYGEDDINLSDLYTLYTARYDELLRKDGGEKIKADMEEALAELITADTDLSAIRGEYNTWIADPNNELSDVEGFAETFAAFEKAESRVTALIAAKAEAQTINASITNLHAAVMGSGATTANQSALEALRTTIETWISTYFSGEYAVEAGNVNYNMVNHDGFKAVDELHEEKVGGFLRASEEFRAIVQSLTTIDLMSYDEIAAAEAAYTTYLSYVNAENFDYVFPDDSKTPGYYYDILLDKAVEYELLREAALNSYNSAFAGVDGMKVDNVTIYNGAAIQAMLDWYTNNCTITGGELDDANTGVADGYVLSETLTITDEDYQAIVALKAAYDTLENAKLAEKAEIEGMIAAIGSVTMNSKDAIEAAEAAYTAWLAGTEAPEGFADAQFAIDALDATYAIDNYATLTAARAAWDILKAEADAIHASIENLEAKVNSGDFGTGMSRDDYEIAIDAIYAAIDTFKTNNGGDLEGNISDTEFAKLVAGELAIAKYDACAELGAAADSAKADIDATTLSDGDKDALKAKADAVLANAKLSVDAVAADSEIADIVALAKAKFVAFAELGAAADTAMTDIDATTLSDDDKAALKANVNAVLTTAIADVADAAADSDIADIAALAKAKFEALGDSSAVYASYVDAVNADNAAEKETILLKLAYSYEMSVERIQTATTIAAVNQNKDLVSAELDAIYSITP